jgi:hypothetical protein
VVTFRKHETQNYAVHQSGIGVGIFRKIIITRANSAW